VLASGLPTAKIGRVPLSATAARARVETIPPGQVFLLGDNAVASIESRPAEPAVLSRIRPHARRDVMVDRPHPGHRDPWP